MFVTISNFLEQKINNCCKFENFITTDKQITAISILAFRDRSTSYLHFDIKNNSCCNDHIVYEHQMRFKKLLSFGNQQRL